MYIYMKAGPAVDLSDAAINLNVVRDTDRVAIQRMLASARGTKVTISK